MIESDVEGYRYRRYQKVLDVELPIPGNPAVGHTATYVRAGHDASAEGEPAEVVPVFVTRYERAEGLAESVGTQLRGLEAYTLDVETLSREHVWRLRGESGDVWLLWVSGKQVVKIGAPQGEPRVPAPVAGAYLDYYPSDLDRKGGVRRRASSAGEASK